MAVEAHTDQPGAGKPVGRRQPLNRQRVLEAALAYADTHGLAGLTMRRLGAALGVEGMSLYKHVADKDALLDGIVELLWAEVPHAPKPDADWRDALRQLANELRAVFSRHPNAAPLLVTRNFVNIQSLRHYQAYLRVLQQAGFDRQGALDAIGAVVGQAFGFGLVGLRAHAAAPDAAGQDSDIQRIRRVTRSLPAEAPDALVELAMEITCSDPDRCFAITLDALLDGLTPKPTP